VGNSTAAFSRYQCFSSPFFEQKPTDRPQIIQDATASGYVFLELVKTVRRELNGVQPPRSFALVDSRSTS
jgi:hypothetical protein